VLLNLDGETSKWLMKKSEETRQGGQIPAYLCKEVKMEKVIYAIVRCQGDLHADCTTEVLRESALKIGNSDTIEAFSSLEVAEKYLKTCVSSFDFFSRAGIRYANATVFWLVKKIVEVDEYGNEYEIDCEFLDAARWETEGESDEN
jgi:hypothetical protein